MASPQTRLTAPTSPGRAPQHAGPAKTGEQPKQQEQETPKQQEPQKQEQEPKQEQKQEPKQDANLAEFIAAPATLGTDPEIIEATKPRNARSPEQLTLDKVVAEYHQRWIKAEKPNRWPDMVGKKTVATYFVPPEHAAKIKTFVNRAALLHGVRARFGTAIVVTETMVKKHGLPESHLGREVISFAVMDKVDRGERTKKVEKVVGVERPK